jgi:hypothetical protein
VAVEKNTRRVDVMQADGEGMDEAGRGHADTRRDFTGQSEIKTR